MSTTEEIIQHEGRHYILATSPRADERSRVLKHGDTFAVFDRYGDIRPVGLGEEGLYHQGTRFLSRLTLRLNGRQPLLLSSTVRDDNAVLAVDLTNADVAENGRIVLARDTLHLWRTSFLLDGTLYMRLRAHNFAAEPLEALLELAFTADFVDIFEIRGERRPARGTLLPPCHGEDWVEMAYEGLDGVVRRTRVEFSPAPVELSTSHARLPGRLTGRGEREYFLTVRCLESAGEGNGNGAARSAGGYAEALERQTEGLRRERAAGAEVVTSSGRFNTWLRRSAADVHLMVTQTPCGPYPYAGVPWFNTVFGRDGIITALEYLWLDPDLARGVLRYLAADQAKEEDAERDAQPGKILHEVRGGEMAALGEIPFGRYYGSVDATPLFVMLAGAYYERTADRALVEEIWPNIEAALEWMERYGDEDGDGFIEYARRSSTGLVTQGWKDSHDSVFHADGSLARAPIALCEVQGYAYAAWGAAARLARVAGRPGMADGLARKAEALRERFEEVFWVEELSTYALALDGEKRACRVRTSNAGHCLFAGVASPERARRVAETLLGESSFSGWGVRTVADTEARYNPMSYHNGSVWPHDNAMIAYGMGRYGLNAEAAKVLGALFDVSQSVDLHRMPELFCGFRRRPGEGPTQYPVACAPQAWSAGSVFMLLQGCLGMTIDAPGRRVQFRNPALPPAIQHMAVNGLKIGDAVVDLSFDRYAADVGVNIVRREREVELVVVK